MRESGRDIYIEAEKERNIDKKKQGRTKRKRDRHKETDSLSEKQ